LSPTIRGEKYEQNSAGGRSSSGTKESKCCHSSSAQLKDNNVQSEEDVIKLWTAYGSIYYKSQTQETFKTFGSNDYIDPEVGDSLCTIPAILAPQWSRWVSCSYNPNFHFAGVVILIENARQEGRAVEHTRRGRFFQVQVLAQAQKEKFFTTSRWRTGLWMILTG
jgi:hypothetical protein